MYLNKDSWRGEKFERLWVIMKFSYMVNRGFQMGLMSILFHNQILFDDNQVQHSRMMQSVLLLVAQQEMISQ